MLWATLQPWGELITSRSSDHASGMLVPSDTCVPSPSHVPAGTWQAEACVAAPPPSGCEP